MVAASSNARLARVRGGFSLIELVIVVVIIGVIAAIAIPRMSRGGDAARESSLTANLATLRNAIELFHTEHDDTWPGVGTISDQLLLFSNLAGATSTTKTTTHIYGPYLRAVPALPVGAKKGSTTIAAADGAGVGWIYDDSTGSIRANTTTSEVDARGVKFSDY